MADEFVHAVDTETFSYVFDWASLLALGPLDNLGTDSVFGLRLLALPKKSSIRTELPGVYAVNESQEASVDQVHLPMLVSMKDAGQPDMIAYAFKLAGSPQPKVYVAAVPASLRISADKWVDDSKETQLLKMDVIKGFNNIKNVDGNSMQSTTDEWMKEHSVIFNGDKMPHSVKLCKSWGNAPNLFGKNVPHIIDKATLLLRRSAKVAAGASPLRRGTTGRSSRQKSSEDNHGAERDALAPQIETLEKAKEVLMANAKYYNMPLRHRIMEASFEVCENGDVEIGGLEKFITDATKLKGCPKQFGSELLGLKKSEIIKSLAVHAADPLAPSSPMLRPHTPPSPKSPPQPPPQPPSTKPAAAAADLQNEEEQSPHRPFEDLGGGLLGDESEQEPDKEPAPAAANADQPDVVVSPGSERQLRDRSALTRKSQPESPIEPPKVPKPHPSKPKSTSKPHKPAAAAKASKEKPEKRKYTKSDRWYEVHGGKAARSMTAAGTGKVRFEAIDVDEDDEGDFHVSARREQPGGALAAGMLVCPDLNRACLTAALLCSLYAIRNA